MDSHKIIIRNGKPLIDWLLELIAEDALQAYPAAKEIEKFATGVPEGYTDLSDYYTKTQDFTTELPERIRSEFKLSVKSTLGAKDFDANAFIHTLLGRMLNNHKAQSGRHTRKSEQEDRVMDKLFDKMEENTSKENQDRQMDRMAKALCYDCNMANPNVQYADCLSQQTAGMYHVFNALDEELLLDQDSLIKMIQINQLARQAGEALERMGPKAHAFAPILFEFMNKDLDDLYAFKYSKALASIIREDKELIHKIVGLVNTKETAISKRALEVLAVLGRTAAESFPECVLITLQKTNSQEPIIVYFAIQALGTIGHGIPEVVDRLLECTYSPDPIMQGEAIMALGELAEKPDRVIPRLIELFDEYKEYDPDYTYESDYDRIGTALRHFGPAAKAAIPAIIKHLSRKDPSDGIYDEVLIEALEAIGPESIQALGELEQIAQECGYTEQDIELAGKGDDILGYTIRQLRLYKENV